MAGVLPNVPMKLLGFQPLVIMSSANIVGSIPNGWWNDRVGVNTQLRDNLRAFKDGSRWSHWPCEVILVVEGQTKDIKSIKDVQVESAGSGIGDDKIVELVHQNISRQPVMVTANRELVRRVSELGVTTRSPPSITGYPGTARWRNRRKRSNVATVEEIIRQGKSVSKTTFHQDDFQARMAVRKRQTQQVGKRK